MKGLFFLAFLAVGCDPRDGGPGPGDDSDADTDADADGDADSDPSAFDGAWSGSIEVAVLELSTAREGTCRGAAALQVDAAAEPALTGTASCAFDGDPAEKVVPPLSFTLEGDFTEGLQMAGDAAILAGHAEGTAPWSGGFAAGPVPSFSAAWSGEVAYYHYLVAYDASIEAAPAP